MKPTQPLSVPLACLAALVTLSGVDATPFANNPFTTSDCGFLSHTSPVYGAVSPDLDVASITYGEVVYEVSKSIKSIGCAMDQASTTVSTEANKALDVLQQRRHLEATNNDIQKLEEFFGESMEVNAKTLPLSGNYYVMPWPSSYWAVYLDGINYRWSASKEASAAEKYATAFGLDVSNFTSAVSKSTGVLSMESSKPSCSVDEDCSDLNDGSVCAIREGESQGYCIPTWFGICHAWAPAALLEPEPNCVAEKNGVTFQPMDIKALLSEIYDGADMGTVFTGVRYYGPDSDATTDQYGRYTEGSRRDIGPGFLHVALANIIGRLNSSVVIDVTGGAEVWNQPVYGYEVLTQTELSLEEAGNQYYQTNTYPFNDAAERIMYTETNVTWMVETFEDGGLVATGQAAKYTVTATYKYLLELDNDYNILGGEWVGDSQSEHPDFLWLPKARPDLSTVTDVGLSYANVRELLDLATNCS